MEYYSAIKNNFCDNMNGPVGTMVMEISQTKDKYHMISLICRI